jgi:NADPH-dependent glutamate synthase beta subunit-like oxidoreductase/NAD-dependent dihydropyrimidine dehydrogenase PreA subunit
MRVYQWETGVYPNVRLHMLPIMCYHCENPVCLEACENKAIYKEEKYGAVLVDLDKCQGTRKCWLACPYGTPQFEGDEPGMPMLKCDMCIDRLDEGLQPICVLSCGMRALEFGPLDEIIRKYGSLNRLGAKPGYAPCRLACPAEVNAEGYITLLFEGKVREAIELFRETTPFAGVLGRICTHPCEVECQRGKIDQPVSVRSLKRYMADEELKLGREKATPVKKTKEDRVAIIGSGPAGLSCAYDLARQGYPVTVFEAAPESGGMLRYGIPQYRLPKEILDNEISYIEELGVEIRTNTPLKNLEDIFNQRYKAVFLATGAWVNQKLDIPGEDAKGVIYALDFLKEVNSGEKVELGNKVAVIGGGSVAIDAARLSLRLGAKEVHLICLESRDLTGKDRMLAQDWEIEEAEEEGVIIHPCLGVKKISTQEGKLIGLEATTCTSVWDADGSFAPKFAEGPALTIKVDTVIIAIGQRPSVGDFEEVEKTLSGAIKTDGLTLETNIKGVFAGADVVTGPADVISAIAQGKQAAISIDRYLSGLDLREARSLPIKSVSERAGVKSARPAVLPVEERKGFTEVEQGFNDEEAYEQANHCFRCGSTMPCVVFKPADPKVSVIFWDPIRALELWQERQPHEGEPLPDIFTEISDITLAPEEIVGRNKLVLKAKDSQELLYYTTDNE